MQVLRFASKLHRVKISAPYSSFTFISAIAYEKFQSFFPSTDPSVDVICLKGLRVCKNRKKSNYSWTVEAGEFERSSIWKKFLKVVYNSINLFHATGLFLYPLKKWENLWFSDILRRHRKRPVAWNGLIQILEDFVLNL